MQKARFSVAFLLCLFSNFVLAFPLEGEILPQCTQPAGALPDSLRAKGQEDLSNPIKHIIVIMQENHSFDNYFGRLDSYTYQGQVDGLKNATDSRSFHETKYCYDNNHHDWDTLHQSWNLGKNDKFNPAFGRPFGYFDETDLNYYYALADRFAIADRYFSSVMATTFPNRMFFMTGTADGEVNNSSSLSYFLKDRRNIFDLLSENKVSWKYYFANLPSIGLLPKAFFRNVKHLALMSEFKKDLRRTRLPQVIFLDNSWYSNEEPPKVAQWGQRTIAKRINDIIASEHWKDSVVFFTYDEAGGFYDHVAPPLACAPDEVLPILKPNQYKDDYGRYGFRVPFISISPFSKRHFVSHVVYDHTSILKFIESKYNLPALTRRDANANNLLDLFDFDHPDYEVNLPVPFLDQQKFLYCKLKYPNKSPKNF